MFHLHTVQMPDGGGPQLPDRLMLASVIGLPYPAAANALGTAGAVTAGSLYTATPTILATGGVLNAAGPGGGWAAIVRATLKVVGVPTIGVGGSGYVTNDTVTFSNGVILTAATVVSGGVTVWSVSNAGVFVGPGGVPVNPVSQISTSGVGINATANLSWGLNTVLIDDSGNYSTIPTGFSVTNAVGDSTGTGGAVAAGAATATGAAVFRAVGPFPADGIPPLYGVFAMINASPANDEVALANKVTGYASLKIQPAVVANAVVAGALDALIWA